MERNLIPIRIISNSSGDSDFPEVVKRAWFGLILYRLDILVDAAHMALTDGQPKKPGVTFICVPQTIAMNILRKHRYEAWKYLHDKRYPKKDENFFFRKEDIVDVGPGKDDSPSIA